jgi:hypothetical protein
VQTQSGSIEIHTRTPTRALFDLCSWAVEHGIELEALQVSGASLEQVYLQLTGAGDDVES